VATNLNLDQWRQGLPEIVRSCAADWSLRVGTPFAPGAGGFAAPVERADGSTAVLKVVLPHRESEHEADALDVWDGEGAVGLLERDQARHALLVERCEPGTPLSKARREDPLQVVADLLPRLWKPATTPFRSLSTEAAWWTSYLERRWEEFSRPFERRLLDAALEFLTELPATQGQQVLVHQDLHGDNVLAAAREPWLVIDPKPLTGEREFALAPIVRSSELGHSPHAIRRRLDRLSGDLGLDRERARCWRRWARPSPGCSTPRTSRTTPRQHGGCSTCSQHTSGTASKLVRRIPPTDLALRVRPRLRDTG